MTALNYLTQNPLLHMGMIVPIKRGTAQILYAGEDGVCLLETKSGAHMLSVSSLETGRALLSQLPSKGIFSFHQPFMLDDFKEKVRFSTLLENYQAVYLSEEPLPISCDIEIKPLGINHFDVIMGTYDVDVGADYLKNRLESKELFGGFVGAELVGFIGVHAEGSIGMLKVFDQHLKKGYGTALTSYAINHQLAQDIIPFEQVGVNNKASLAIAQKLGFSISTDKVYWLFHSDF
ncbi:MAG: GNAT family N-acetyltransferase [Defluviitaleaceae bacterium]|nr:GNAT family N-acetyltransferase [Defluviitaleaceae bacterium]